ncbi:hypothetical protein FRC19_008249 [Serendipita sp. 401]|nr:hypothetical protein FRC19_008249 [Serendipita sp. 401]KAG8837965.1 hypothetical protein FRC18_007053 [Serendipita sp. 400]
MPHLHQKLAYASSQVTVWSVQARKFHMSAPLGRVKRNLYRDRDPPLWTLYGHRSTLQASPWGRDKSRYNDCRDHIKCAIELTVQSTGTPWNHQPPEATWEIYQVILRLYPELHGFIGIITFARILDGCLDNKRRYARMNPNKRQDKAMDRAQTKFELIQRL